MFHSLNLRASLNERRGSFYRFHMIDEGIDDRFIGQVRASELVSVICRSRMEGYGNFAAGMQGATG
jgi:hypothetical protein